MQRASDNPRNPRQIKRFLNALALRLAVAHERGFGEAIDESHLAKIMLAELFLPQSVFDHIATVAASSPEGICPEIEAIEKFVTAKPAAPVDDGDRADSEQTNPVIEEWKTRPEVLRWAAVKPDLGAVSLEPYLFVIKDRKNYLGSVAPLSPKLMALLDRLLGGDMAAKGAVGEVRELNVTDAALVFDSLRKKVLETSNFGTKPVAMAGVAAMVEGQPRMKTAQFRCRMPVNAYQGPDTSEGKPLADPRRQKCRCKKLSRRAV